jgi:hypothetical protein
MEEPAYFPRYQGLQQTEWNTSQMEEPTYLPRSQGLQQTGWSMPMEEPSYATKLQSLWQPENYSAKPLIKPQRILETVDNAQTQQPEDLKVEPTVAETRKTLQGPTTELTDAENRKVLLDVVDTK